MNYNTLLPDIYVATIIDSHNYGTCLQAVATREVLSKYGKPIFIDYCRPQWTKRGWVKSYMNRSKMSTAEKILRMAANVPVRNKIKKVFRPFVERELELCSSASFLSGKEDSFDTNAVYCVGSDQTWNMECNSDVDPVFFLRRVPMGCRKIAFAASFGRAGIDCFEALQIKSLLEQFSAISVRESSGINILKSMGLNGVALKDPVLTCQSELWFNLAAGISKRDDKYVLVYMLNDNQRMCDFARRLARQRGLQARIITFSPLRRAPYGLEGVCLPKPEEWIALFRDASFVVTDSFHGTCFSLLFERPMIVFDPPKYSIRLEDMLNDFGLAERRVKSVTEADVISSKDIDWNYVRLRRQVFCNDAQGFLAEAFSRVS